MRACRNSHADLGRGTEKAQRAPWLIARKKGSRKGAKTQRGERENMAVIPPENEVAREVVDAAFRVHTTLGPGLLESVYEAVLAYELRRRGHAVDCQVPIAVT